MKLQNFWIWLCNGQVTFFYIWILRQLWIKDSSVTGFQIKKLTGETKRCNKNSLPACFRPSKVRILKTIQLLFSFYWERKVSCLVSYIYSNSTDHYWITFLDKLKNDLKTIKGLMCREGIRISRTQQKGQKTRHTMMSTSRTDFVTLFGLVVITESTKF